MTLRYNDAGRPEGLDWTVCNDGNPKPELWTIVKKKPYKPRSHHKKMTRPDVGRHGIGSEHARRVSETIEAAVIEAYEKGVPTPDIARATGIARTTIYNVLKRHQIKKRRDSQELRTL